MQLDCPCCKEITRRRGTQYGRDRLPSLFTKKRGPSPEGTKRFPARPAQFCFPRPNRGMRHISFHADAWQDYLYWYQTSKSTFKKINELIRDTQRNPFTGLGKPEVLKHDFQGCWSRRITREHRLVYPHRVRHPLYLVLSVSLLTPGRVSYRLTNVFFFEFWIRLQHLWDGLTPGQHFEYHAYGDPHAPNSGLSQADVGIDRYAVKVFQWMSPIH